MGRMAGVLPYALLGSGGMTAANLALVQAGNAWDGEQQMSGSDKLQTVLAALAGLTMGAGFGDVWNNIKDTEFDERFNAEGNMRVGVVDPNDVTQRATMDKPRAGVDRYREKQELKTAVKAAAQDAYDQGAVNRAANEKMAKLIAMEARGFPDVWNNIDEAIDEFDRTRTGQVHAEPWAAQRRPA